MGVPRGRGLIPTPLPHPLNLYYWSLAISFLNSCGGYINNQDPKFPSPKLRFPSPKLQFPPKTVQKYKENF